MLVEKNGTATDTREGTYGVVVGLVAGLAARRFGAIAVLWRTSTANTYLQELAGSLLASRAVIIIRA